ncbi:hypothetical protein Moror_16196 [Moniliophthora roreri MCA 2997]|uniref:Uncharacterized protein n=2 Tax=Moniliophthora roreri TaxID=221103 RepID=V2XA78_MONRO|nr:hypothetical protein Moror_16196 [Moniliophthora roreri MCA 2997]KAI3614986.1 hypothetical protein WG66_016804 [Moniliophthora roreri]
MSSNAPEAPQEPIQALINDPPPPYPIQSSPGRTRRTRRNRRTTSEPLHSQVSSESTTHSHELDSTEASETTPLLMAHPNSSASTARPRRLSGRPRSASHGSVFSASSAAPSLAQTVVTLFQAEYDSDYGAEGDESTDAEHEDNNDDHRRDHNQVSHAVHSTQHPPLHNPFTSPTQDHDFHRKVRHGLFSKSFWRRYYHPLTRRPYYAAFFHLVVLNFPFALAAWVYLFVFTLTGTALLITLPIGALLCFLNALGARIFARGELYLQRTFHGTSSFYPFSDAASSNNPLPIFTRMRPPSAAEIESGYAAYGDLVPEESFYRNSYFMFTDPTTYQALFYFLVIKSVITLVLSLLILVVFIPMIVLGLITAGVTVPPAMRAIRRLGRWQAGVAVDGLVGVKSR